MPNDYPSSAVFKNWQKKRLKDNSELIKQERRLNNDTTFPCWRLQERAINTLQGTTELKFEVNNKANAPSQDTLDQPTSFVY